jgi:hypothetical protein
MAKPRRGKKPVAAATPIERTGHKRVPFQLTTWGARRPKAGERVRGVYDVLGRTVISPPFQVLPGVRVRNDRNRIHTCEIVWSASDLWRAGAAITRMLDQDRAVVVDVLSGFLHDIRSPYGRYGRHCLVINAYHVMTCDPDTDRLKLAFGFVDPDGGKEYGVDSPMRGAFELDTAAGTFEFRPNDVAWYAKVWPGFPKPTTREYVLDYDSLIGPPWRYQVVVVAPRLVGM